jgi:tight adherence protein C
VDPLLLWLIGLSAAFGCIAILALAMTSSMVERRRVYRSLQSMGSSEIAGADVRQRELATPFTQRVLLPGLGAVGRGVRRFAPDSVVERLDQELVYAGSPAGWDGARLFALKTAAGVAFLVGAVLFLPLSGVGVLRTIVIAPFAAFVGYYLPEWILRSRSGKRQTAMQRALPDALDLMAITVQAGLGFDAAVDRVAREMGGPLGQELHRVGQEMRLGKARGEALRDLGDRTTVPELKAFVLAMVQAEIFGISISRVLNVQAAELRVKRRQRAEEAAQKLPVKIVFPLILCIFPALMLVLLGPAAISIYENLITN